MTTTKFAVDELMTKAFAPGRDPRSQEYKQAVLSILSLRIDGVRHAPLRTLALRRPTHTLLDRMKATGFGARCGRRIRNGSATRSIRAPYDAPALRDGRRHRGRGRSSSPFLELTDRAPEGGRKAADLSAKAVCENKTVLQPKRRHNQA